MGAEEIHCEVEEQSHNCPMPGVRDRLKQVRFINPHGAPLSPDQIQAIQCLIDYGSIEKLDRATGGDSWARLAKLLIESGKCKPPKRRPRLPRLP
jgi:hypothetical protein